MDGFNKLKLQTRLTEELSALEEELLSGSCQPLQNGKQHPLGPQLCSTVVTVVGDRTGHIDARLFVPHVWHTEFD